jgi:flagellar biosynthetic protein FliP
MMHQVLPIGLLKVLGMLLLSVCHFSTLSAQETASVATAIDSDASDRPPELIERGLHRLMGEVLKAEPVAAKSAATTSGARAASKDASSNELLGGSMASLRWLILLGTVGLVPAALLLTTCYVRIVVVFGLLRSALGTQQLPPAHVTTAIALFMTFFIMAPVWSRVYREAIEPYGQSAMGDRWQTAWERGVQPIREFMERQIDQAGNHDEVHLFLQYDNPGATAPQSFDQVPFRVLMPAFLISELKTAFLIGFQIFLPFLMVDLLVASVIVAMGLSTLSPTVISFPFKLLLFVLLDGWRLVVELLLASFGTIG